jgi:hypothetical protein
MLLDQLDLPTAAETTAENPFVVMVFSIGVNNATTGPSTGTFPTYAEPLAVFQLVVMVFWTVARNVMTETDTILTVALPFARTNVEMVSSTWEPNNATMESTTVTPFPTVVAKTAEFSLVVTSPLTLLPTKLAMVPSSMESNGEMVLLLPNADLVALLPLVVMVWLITMSNVMMEPAMELLLLVAALPVYLTVVTVWLMLENNVMMEQLTLLLLMPVVDQLVSSLTVVMVLLIWMPENNATQSTLCLELTPILETCGVPLIANNDVVLESAPPKTILPFNVTMDVTIWMPPTDVVKIANTPAVVMVLLIQESFAITVMALTTTTEKMLAEPTVAFLTAVMVWSILVRNVMIKTTLPETVAIPSVEMNVVMEILRPTLERNVIWVLTTPTPLTTAEPTANSHVVVMESSTLLRNVTKVSITLTPPEMHAERTAVFHIVVMVSSTPPMVRSVITGLQILIPSPSVAPLSVSPTIADRENWEMHCPSSPSLDLFPSMNTLVLKLPPLALRMSDGLLWTKPLICLTSNSLSSTILNMDWEDEDVPLIAKPLEEAPSDLADPPPLSAETEFLMPEKLAISDGEIPTGKPTDADWTAEHHLAVMVSLIGLKNVMMELLEARDVLGVALWLSERSILLLLPLGLVLPHANGLSWVLLTVFALVTVLVLNNHPSTLTPRSSLVLTPPPEVSLPEFILPMTSTLLILEDNWPLFPAMSKLSMELNSKESNSTPPPNTPSMVLTLIWRLNLSTKKPMAASLVLPSCTKLELLLLLSCPLSNSTFPSPLTAKLTMESLMPVNNVMMVFWTLMSDRELAEETEDSHLAVMVLLIVANSVIPADTHQPESETNQLAKLIVPTDIVVMPVLEQENNATTVSTMVTPKLLPLFPLKSQVAQRDANDIAEMVSLMTVMNNVIMEPQMPISPMFAERTAKILDVVMVSVMMAKFVMRALPSLSPTLADLLAFSPPVVMVLSITSMASNVIMESTTELRWATVMQTAN